MKLLKTITILLLVAGLPALSWYYLSQGADWRKQGLEAIANKDLVDLTADPMFSAAYEELEVDRIFTIATDIDADNAENLKLLNRLADQFSYREDLVMLYRGNGSNELAEEWIQSNCSSTNCVRLYRILFPEGTNAAIIDDSSYLRRSYNIKEEKGIKELIEHAAILFPVEKRAKLELRRGSNQ